MLESGEMILWSAEPSKKIYLKAIDLLLIPWGLLCSIISGLWSYMAYQNVMRANQTLSFYGNVFFLFGLVCLAGSLYFLVGRFAYIKMRKNKEKYTLTNRRLLIEQGKVAISIGHDEAMSIRIQKNFNMEFGTIIIGENLTFRTTYMNTGLEFFYGRRKIYILRDLANYGFLAESLKNERRKTHK